MDWLPSLVRLRCDRLLTSLGCDPGLSSPDLPAAGLAPGGGVGLDGCVDSRLVDIATTMINTRAIRAFLARIGQAFEHSVSLSDRIEDCLPDELATRCASHATYLSRLADGDLQSWAITQTDREVVVLCDESDSMEALGPHGLAGVVWAHALVRVLNPTLAFSFGGGQVRAHTPGRRLGGGTNLESAIEHAERHAGPNHTVVIISDGRVRMDRAPYLVSEYGLITVPDGRLATIPGPQVGLVDLLK